MHVRKAPPQLVLFTILLVAALAAAGCGTKATRPAGVEAAAPSALAPRELSRAIAAQERASDALLARAGVVGTGATLDANGHARVLVLLASGTGAGLPADADGVPIETYDVGEIQPWALTGTYRPMPIGVSAGNANECLPGTIGCVLKRGTHRYALSANHVFARQNQGAIGESIVQPSLPDLSADCSAAPVSAVVGRLADFEPVVYDGKTRNVMDAAIAEITLPQALWSPATPAGFYGAPSSVVAAPELDMAVMKVGRTTGWTHATIKAVNVKTKITFPSGTAKFVNQVLTTRRFGDFGDSGSLVVTDDGTRRPIGIVIGGSANGSAVVSPIGPILARFNVSVCTH